jgi:hypothetical protein
MSATQRVLARSGTTVGCRSFTVRNARPENSRDLMARARHEVLDL